MSILVKNIRLSLNYSDEDILKRLRRELQFAPDCRPAWRFRRRSLDARRKNDLHFLADIEVDLPWHRSYAAKPNLSLIEEKKAEKWCSKESVSAASKGQECQTATSADQENQTAGLAGQENQAVVSSSPNHESANTACLLSQQHNKLRPLVVGSGPAGLFAAWALACEGIPPIILERGPELSERIRKVEDFRRGGPFDPEANIPFGEGGAGTFSDGKLLSRIKDTRAALVPRIFALCGAPEEILWEQKPHIGTDRLRAVLYKMRQKLIQMGVEFRFNCRVDGLWIDSSGDAVSPRQLQR